MALEIGTSFNTNQTSLIRQQIEKREEENEKLASGKRINSAADDAAGLQQSERLGALINQSGQEQRNFQNDVARLNTQAGELGDAVTNTQDIGSLLTAAGGGLNTESDLQAIQQEIDQLVEATPDAAALGLDTIDVVSGDPQANQDALNSALETLGGQQTDIGAQVNGLESATRTAANSFEQQSAARSRILDTDFAEATSDRAARETLLQSALQAQKEEEESNKNSFNAFI